MQRIGKMPVLTRLVRYYEEKLKPAKRSRIWENVSTLSRCFSFFVLGVFMAACLTVIVNDRRPMPAYRASEFRFEDFDAEAPRQRSKTSIRQSGEGRRAVDQRWRGTQSIPEDDRRSDTTEDNAQSNDDGT
jgi:hypothetical protein